MRALTNFFVAAAMLAPAAAQASGWHSYRNAQMGFAISYPDDWRVDTGHLYTGMGPGKDIHGVAFNVRKSFTTGTNLSDDSYFAVEILPGVKQCRAALFLDDAIGKPRIKSGNNGLQWEVLDGADQGAGNSYEETVQAVVGSQPCIATRAFAHSTNVGNYDPGTVKQFNRRALNATIDKMRRSFRLLPR